MSKRLLSSIVVEEEEEGEEEPTKKSRLSEEQSPTSPPPPSPSIKEGTEKGGEEERSKMMLEIQRAGERLQGFVQFIESLAIALPGDEEEIMEAINEFFWGKMSSDNDDHRLYEECKKTWDLMHEYLKKSKKWESKYGCEGGVYQMLLESAIERDDVNAFKYMRLSCKDKHFRKLAGEFEPIRYEDTYQLMRACCRCGSLKVLKQMKKMNSLRDFNAPEGLGLKAMGDWEVKQAVRENHRELFDWLMDETLVRNDASQYSDSVEEMACLGRIEMYQRMIRKQLLPSSWDPETGEVRARQNVCKWEPKLNYVGVHLRLAALGGHWTLFDWILEESKRERWGLKISSEVFCSMVPTAPLLRLKKLVKVKQRRVESYCHDDDDLTIGTANNGRSYYSIDSNNADNNIKIESHHIPYRALFSAMVCKRWDVVKWMVEELKDVPIGSPEDVGPCSPMLLATGGEGSKYTKKMAYVDRPYGLPGQSLLVPSCSCPWFRGRPDRPLSYKSFLRDLLAYADSLENIKWYFNYVHHPFMMKRGTSWRIGRADYNDPEKRSAHNMLPKQALDIVRNARHAYVPDPEGGLDILCPVRREIIDWLENVEKQWKEENEEKEEKGESQ